MGTGKAGLVALEMCDAVLPSSSGDLGERLGAVVTLLCERDFAAGYSLEDACRIADEYDTALRASGAVVSWKELV